MEVNASRSLVINAPEFFEDPAFMAWLNNGKMKFSWHIKGNWPETKSTHAGKHRPHGDAPRF